MMPHSPISLKHRKRFGFGFRAGFLGLLHMEIVQERLDREFNIDIITTVPNVRYEIDTEEAKRIRVDNPSEMPDAGKVEYGMGTLHKSKYNYSR
jgi:GTP-binding protein LepA